MRILLVTHFFSTHRGGIEIAAQRLAAGMAAEPGISVEWMASDCDPLPRDLPAQVRCRPAASWNAVERRTGLPYPLWSPAALAELRRAVRECDVVHVHDSLYLPNALACLLAQRQRKPFIVTQHIGAIPFDGAALRGAHGAMNRTLGRAVLGAADRVFFVSPAVQRYFEQFCTFRAAPLFVPNGVDGELYAYADASAQRAARHAAGRDPERPVCLFVGRFVARKGVDLVVALARALPEVDWILAGDGPLRPEDGAPANLAVVRGRAGREIAALYRMADLLVLPSVGEGFPLVVQESMACGTPALVSPQTAEGAPGVAALLFTEAVSGADTPARWAARVRALLGDGDVLRGARAQVAAAARAQWSWDAAARRYLEAIRGAAGR